jgi:hypothetical protein
MKITITIITIISTLITFTCFSEKVRQEDGRIAEIKYSDIDESSGIVPSRRHEGIFWTHNDSGDSARIFTIHLDGTLAGIYKIDGAGARDWESIAIDSKGFIYIADIGNNNRKRKDLAIYKVMEPEVISTTGSLKVEEKIPVSYPDRNYDCEGLCVSPDGTLYLITKSPKPCVMFKYSNNTWKKVQQLPIRDRVTGADMNEKGDLALSTYVGVQIFRKTAETWNETQFILANIQQCEAVCWLNDSLLFTSEQRSIFRITPSKYKKEDRVEPSSRLNITKSTSLIPKDDYYKNAAGISFRFSGKKKKYSEIILSLPDNRSRGKAVFLFSTDEPAFRTGYNETDSILNISRSGDSITAKLTGAVKYNLPENTRQPRIKKLKNGKYHILLDDNC